MAKTALQRSDPAAKLIAALRRVAGDDEDEKVPDRATLAKLRRGLGKEFGQPGAAARDGWVLECLDENASQAEVRRCCLIASLFALHPKSGGRGSLGAAFRRLLATNPESEGPERRLVALLDSDPADLPGRLRHAVSLLKANEIPIDWGRLLTDLRHWSHPDRRVPRRWAMDFWGRSDAADETVTPDA